MNLLHAILLDAEPAVQEASEWSKYQGIIMMVAIVAIFYFLMIRPQQKKQKAVQKAREALKAGDRIVTAGGIHGRIREVHDTTMLIEITDGVRIRVDKMSVYASSEDIQSK
ncbi:MAG: preprotein translocase subunit YajC [Tannerella sp.]|jgi:preprotein translocase subunit YajC|nr:preprotein translocase subunit YajC [Tannerella sp.]